MKKRHFKVLVLSRAYPNNLLPTLGLWVRNLVYHSKDFCEIKVISPVPYFPPVITISKYSRFRKSVKHSCNNGVETFYPRLIVDPDVLSIFLKRYHIIL